MRLTASPGLFFQICATIIVIAFQTTALSFTARSETVINIRPAQGAGDVAHSYFSELITTILNRTSAKYGLAKLHVTSENLTQQRSLKLLEEGRRIDLDWAGTNLGREQALHPVRIPLNMGLLGYRLLVIRQDRVREFDQIRTPAQLKTLIACQGQHWPDSDILEDNGYTVNRTIRFELMWKMIEVGRCDYFPRAISEGYGEVNFFGKDTYAAYDKILIGYRFPMYFFVNKSNQTLAARIEEGLEAMLEDNSLLQFMKRHPATKSAFPLGQYANSRIFTAENKYISEETRNLPEKYWLKVIP
ncbi:hypothetical protein [Kiloniella litopenaei]|uniref:hypothetical protein n=1 Tax=Kiloniella litopenaei TaxID=1549748 RepID=UPI00069885AC|nr:hypothetical protein [Kiloniella litopenaei]